MSTTILTVPGYTGSGPGHWQTLWEQARPSIRRVVQRDWDRPVRREWVDVLHRAVRGSGKPVVLVAHSLGCATVVHWCASRRDLGSVVGALLVAPADVDRSGWPAAVTGFRPMPMARLGLESTVVVSQDDPWVTAARARQFAEAWGSRFVDAGALGHLDSNSQLGAWPEGWRLLEELTKRSGLPPLRPGPEADVGPFG